MSGETVRIDELRIRAPGLTAEQARSMAAKIAGLVSSGLNAPTRAEHLGALQLRMPVASSTPRDELAPAIAARILAGLG